MGCIVGPVTGSSSETGLEVMPGVGLARTEISGSSTATAGAHADTINIEIKNSARLEGSRKRYLILYLFVIRMSSFHMGRWRHGNGCIRDLTNMKSLIHDARLNSKLQPD